MKLYNQPERGYSAFTWTLCHCLLSYFSLYLYEEGVVMFEVIQNDFAVLWYMVITISAIDHMYTCTKWFSLGQLYFRYYFLIKWTCTLINFVNLSPYYPISTRPKTGFPYLAKLPITWRFYYIKKDTNGTSGWNELSVTIIIIFFLIF